MDLEKRLLRKMLSSFKSGAFTIVYWDGSEEQFGIGTPFFKLVIKDKSVIMNLVKKPTLAFGEAYVKGAVDVEGDIEEVIRLIHMNKDFLNKFTKFGTGQKITSFFHLLSIDKQNKGVCHHYDISNDFFALWLDQTMSYSCAYFHAPEDTLEQAQLQKIDHTLKKLRLGPGETILDIGSGWGWLIIQAAQQYGATATGITVSREQYAETKERIHKLGLGSLVNVVLEDYRKFLKRGLKFDKIVSIGMFEHVGRSNIPAYMAAVKEMLQPGGLSLLHTITNTTEGPVNPWIEKYIFPYGYIPSLREVVWMLPNYDFHLIDIECLRMHYARTLDRWSENFEKNIDIVKEMYGEEFIRMWRMYLRSSSGSFRHSGLSLHQLLFSKGLRNDLPLTREYLHNNIKAPI